jgi:hypothetical protein
MVPLLNESKNQVHSHLYYCFIFYSSCMHAGKRDPIRRPQHSHVGAKTVLGSVCRQATEHCLIGLVGACLPASHTYGVTAFHHAPVVTHPAHRSAERGSMTAPWTLAEDGRLGAQKQSQSISLVSLRSPPPRLLSAQPSPQEYILRQAQESGSVVKAHGL